MYTIDNINKKRRLNESITKEKDYTYIYTISLELDELIARYYNKEIKRRIYTKDRRELQN